jgi:hypothetical protein
VREELAHAHGRVRELELAARGQSSLSDICGATQRGTSTS